MAAQRGGRSTAALINLGARNGGGVVTATPRPFCPRETDRVPIVQEAEWAPGPVCSGAINLAPLPPPGFDPWTVQPIVSRHTVYVIPATKLWFLC